MLHNCLRNFAFVAKEIMPSLVRIRRSVFSDITESTLVPDFITEFSMGNE